MEKKGFFSTKIIKKNIFRHKKIKIRKTDDYAFSK